MSGLIVVSTVFAFWSWTIHERTSNYTTETLVGHDSLLDFVTSKSNRKDIKFCFKMCSSLSDSDQYWCSNFERICPPYFLNLKSFPMPIWHRPSHWVFPFLHVLQWAFLHPPASSCPSPQRTPKSPHCKTFRGIVTQETYFQVLERDNILELGRIGLH